MCVLLALASKDLHDQMWPQLLPLQNTMWFGETVRLNTIGQLLTDVLHSHIDDLLDTMAHMRERIRVLERQHREAFDAAQIMGVRLYALGEEQPFDPLTPPRAVSPFPDEQGQVIGATDEDVVVDDMPNIP